MSLLTDILKGLPLTVLQREKILELESDNEVLKTECAILKDELRLKEAENKRLKEEIEALTPRDQLDEAKAQLLLILGEKEPLPLDSFLHILKIERVALQYHIHALEDSGYITSRRAAFTRPTVYLLTQKGRQVVMASKRATVVEK